MDRLVDEFLYHGGTEARGILIQVSVDDPCDPVPHDRLSEIHKISQLQTRLPKVNLLLVSGGHSLDGLQFHDAYFGRENFAFPENEMVAGLLTIV